MQVGRYRVEAIVEARFALDGGSMFGVVPRALWERAHPPDERNRIAMVSRLLLVDDGERRILVDTGVGDRWDDKRSEIFAIDRSAGGIEAALADRGLAPRDVTDVVLTHLHFDHAGGTLMAGDGGEPVVRFPRATHWVQRRQWDWACSPTAKDAGSYRAADFIALDGDPRLELVDGECEPFPGLWLHPVDGHTEAMQMVRVEGDAGDLLFASDLVPTHSHVGLPWIMAYDNRPLRTLAEKREWLGRAAAEGWLLVFQHDPRHVAARVVEDDDGRSVLGEPIEL